MNFDTDLLNSKGEGRVRSQWKQAIPRNLRAISSRRFTTRYPSLFPAFFLPRPVQPPVQPLFYLSIHPSILDRYWNRESMLADLKVSLRICMQIPWEIIESICSLLPLETKRDGENRDWWEWASGNFETSRSPSAFPPF